MGFPGVNSYNQIQTVVNSKPSNPNQGTPSNPNVFNQTTGTTQGAGNTAGYRILSTPSPTEVQSMQAYQQQSAAESLAKSASIDQLNQLIDKGGATAQAAANELADRGFVPKITPEVPAATSAASSASTAVAVGGATVAVASAPEALVAAATILSLAVANAYGKGAIDLVYANGGLSQAEKVRDKVEQRYQEALKEAQAIDAARVDSSPKHNPPPFTGGQSVGVLYKVFTASQNTDPVAVMYGNGGYQLDPYPHYLPGPLSVYGNGTSITGILANGVEHEFWENQPLTLLFIDHVERNDGLIDTGGNPAPLIPNQAPVIPAPYPPASEWPYGSPVVTVAGDAAKMLDKMEQAAATPVVASPPPFKDPINPSPLPLAIAPSSPSSPSAPKLQPSPEAKKGNSGTPMPTGVVTNLSKPSFTAKPYVSGVSNPGEASNPVDVKSGLTRSQQDAQWAAQNQAIQDSAQANEKAAALNDAKMVQAQLNNLSDVPNSASGGLSPKQIAANQYVESIKGNTIREDAFKQAQNSPVNQASNGTSNVDILPIVAGLTGVAATVAALKIGSDYLVNNSLANTSKLNEIGANTTPQAQQTNAKQGVCNAMQPSECGFEGVQAATEPILDQAKSNNALLNGLNAVLAGIANFLTATLMPAINAIKAILDNQWVANALTMVNTAVSMHNALMLSQNVATTLGTVIDQALGFLGLNFKDSSGQTHTASEVFGRNAKAFITNIIGADRVVQLETDWKIANRIYQTGMNMASTVQTIVDPVAMQLQSTGLNVSNIGNALRDNRVVSPKSYPHMADDPASLRAMPVDRFAQFTSTIQNVDTSVQHLANITGQVQSTAQSFTMLQTEFKTLSDAANTNSASDIGIKSQIKAQVARQAQITEVTLASKSQDIKAP